MEYVEFHKKFQSRLCPKVWVVRLVSKDTLEVRVRRLMDKAIEMNNREMAQVACDLVADELSLSLLTEMDQLIRTIKTDELESTQRNVAIASVNVSSFI